MTTICAWCPDFNPKEKTNQLVSHTICPECSKRMLAESGLEEIRMPRTMRRNDITYTGFQSADTRPERRPNDILVVAWFDGEPELWICDDAEGIKELRRMYTDEWGNRDIPFDEWTVRWAVPRA